MSNNVRPPFDRNAYMTNFSGLEDLALDTIRSFISALPILIEAIDEALRCANAKKLELTAHTLKGVVSNFYAEPSRILAAQIESYGKKGTVDGVEIIVQELKSELSRLSIELQKELP